MYEYSVPNELHIAVDDNANELLLIAIAAIGNISAEVLKENNPYRIIPPEKKAELEFASRYFDAFLQSGLEPVYPQYYRLLGAIAYYLCDFTGSAKIMANLLVVDKLDLGCNGIEKVLALLLQDKINGNYLTGVVKESSYCDYLNLTIHMYELWFQQHKEPDLKIIFNFRLLVYAHGSPRELLLTDALLAILLIKIERSARNLLPKYSGLESSKWEGMLGNKNSIQELWPAQIRLGEAGVFSGVSATIQMPTSSGKTTSISIAIRSAFLAKRTSLAIIVAPFRALCREICFDIAEDFQDDSSVYVNELSDIFETDDLLELLGSYEDDRKNILVLTPEKLIYLLRQSIELIEEVGLIVFDEAHMFDDATRGAHYELLISTIMLYIGENTQRLLLSAVIPNATQINEWFAKGKGVIVTDNSIRATDKSVAIADWENFRGNTYGYLYFLDSSDQNNLEFFVPRIIEIQTLNILKANEKQRFFPEVNFQTEKVSNNDIAIHLALKLNHNGGVAIFCGTKVSADGVLSRIIEIEKRGINISSFKDNIANEENKRLARLICENYGQDNIYFNAALKGVFAHHRGISNGIRVATEYAMKESLIRCIVCTSTLAQGVNLPIRYLIISNLYQARERIKVRDFHNLIGRAGRAGLYTEGTILLSETFVYSRKMTQYQSWRWKAYLKMLDPRNTELCQSQLLLLVRPEVFKLSYDKTLSINYYPIVMARYNESENFEANLSVYIQQIVSNHPEIEYDIKSRTTQALKCLDAIESYLMSFLSEDTDQNIDELVSNTFAYFLASDEEKQRMKALFLTIKEYLVKTIKSSDKRVAFSHTLLGTKRLFELEEWVYENSEELLNCSEIFEILHIIFPKIIEYSENKSLQSVIIEETILDMANLWIAGASYKQILDYTIENDVKIIRRKKESDIQLGDIIDICDEGFGFASTLIINAIAELLLFNFEESDDATKLLAELCKRMRYGLPSRSSITIYEAGFSDRVISLGLANALNGFTIKNKTHFRRIAKANTSKLMDFLDEYPRVFIDRMYELTK